MAADMGTGKSPPDTKPADAKPAPPKGKGGGADDDDAMPAKKLVPKTPTVSKHTARAIWIGALLISIAMLVGDLWGGRYHLIQSSNAVNTYVFRIDTLKGTVDFCTTQQCIELPLRAAE